MIAKKAVLAVLFMSYILAGCLMVPGPGGNVAMVPLLPPVVVFDSEPYYVHQGYYYDYRSDGWYYARSRRGPWVTLPRDHYPREVRYRDVRDRRGGGEHGH